MLKSILLVECLVEYNGANIKGWSPEHDLPDSFYILLDDLNEQNILGINNPHIKQIELPEDSLQHYIEKNGSGVLAFINPHGFLDNPTFRGMRWNLLKTFDKIYTIEDKSIKLLKQNVIN